MSKRLTLLETARELFTADGFRATGIDTLLERAGVAKMTLYHHFDSKDALALAVVEQVSDEVLAALEAQSAAAADPAEALVGVVGYPAQPAVVGSGCLFHHVCAEFKEADAPLRQAVRDHKRRVAEHLEGLARRAGARDPRALAQQLFVLFEGALAGSESACEAGVADAGVDAARALVSSALA
ncbi:MAG: TetR/AcrR family transcriptional regulator [Planctomycetota bacterium]|jgi:AcrR family transcriptional regulator